MLDVLKSTGCVVTKSKQVNISRKAIRKFANEIKESELDNLESSLFDCSWPLDIQLEIVFIFNAINYCFWAKKDELKWTAEIGDKKIDGAVALLRCIEEEVKKDNKFLWPETLANLDENNLKRITKGNVEIPLLTERLECLRELGAITANEYGSYLKILDHTSDDALKLVETMVTDFPRFNDVSMFMGKSVAFYKRAQLNAKMISDVLVTNGQRPLLSMDKLTAFADYKVPQILRKLGILVYSKKLAKKVDNFELIAVNSPEEVEIRANTIWAVEYLSKEISKTFPGVLPSQVDMILWNKSQQKEPDEKPYHRTLTIAY